MAAALNKIAPTSPSRQRPSELESSIANALYDLESNIPDMKTALRPLQFVSAREVRVTKGTVIQLSKDLLLRVWNQSTLEMPQATADQLLGCHWGLGIGETYSTSDFRDPNADCPSSPDLQLEVGHGKKAIVIFVPVPLLSGFHKVQQRYPSTPPPGLLSNPPNHNAQLIILFP